MNIRDIAIHSNNQLIARRAAVCRYLGRFLAVSILLGAVLAIQQILPRNNLTLFGMLSKTRLSTVAQGGLQCLGSGDQQTIMNRLAQTRNPQGESGKACLCQGSTFNLTSTVVLKT